MTDNAILIAGSAYGIYIPQMFYEFCQGREDYLLALRMSTNSASELSNPDNEYYWETWDMVLHNFRIEISGITYCLYQDMDLWIVPESEITENDYTEDNYTEDD